MLPGAAVAKATWARGVARTIAEILSAGADSALAQRSTSRFQRLVHSSRLSLMTVQSGV